MSNQPKQILFVTAGILFLIVLLQNTQVVTLRLLFWEFGMSQIFLIPSMILLGFVIGYYLGKRAWGI